MSAQHVADICAAGAACLFGVSWSTLDHMVQVVAGVLTAIAAAISITVHFYNWRYRKSKR